MSQLSKMINIPFVFLKMYSLDNLIVIIFEFVGSGVGKYSYGITSMIYS